MPMNIGYEPLLPIALKAMFPNGTKRDIVTGKLETYVAKIFHREQSLVKLGVL
jgi:hypothetical protein